MDALSVQKSVGVRLFRCAFSGVAERCSCFEVLKTLGSTAMAVTERAEP
jgi:hypothetical protein